MSFDAEEFAKVAPMIVFGVNIGYGGFIVMVSVAATLILLSPAALIGVAIGVGLMYVAWAYLKPVRKEGWLYAFILNIISIPTAIILTFFPIYVYFVTFAVIIIIIMILPPMRQPFT